MNGLQVARIVHELRERRREQEVGRKKRVQLLFDVAHELGRVREASKLHRQRGRLRHDRREKTGDFPSDEREPSADVFLPRLEAFFVGRQRIDQGRRLEHGVDDAARERVGALEETAQPRHDGRLHRDAAEVLQRTLHILHLFA